jgi:hypothetical protein
MTLATRRILSVVIAVVAAAIGTPLLWVGGAGVLISTERLQVDAASVALAIGGVVLLAVSIATVVISPLGVGVVGVIHGLIALLALVIPFDPFHGIRSPVWLLLDAVIQPGAPFSTGLTIFIASGISLLIGAVYAMAGLGRRGRLAGRGPSREVLGVLLGTPLMLVGGGLTLWAGGLFYGATFVTLRAEPLGIVFMLLGTLIFAFGVLVDARYSGWGEVVVGGLAVIVGIAAFTAPGIVIRMLGRTWAESLSLVGPSLFLVALGVLLLVAGPLVRLRATAAPIAG